MKAKKNHRPTSTPLKRNINS